MKLISYTYNGKPDAGLLTADLKNIYPFSAFGLSCTDMLSFIDLCSGKSPVDLLTRASGEPIPFEAVKLLAPIPSPRQDIICLGINFTDHATESAKFTQDFAKKENYASYFSKHTSLCTPHEGLIDGHFDICDSLDYEVELAAIIGKDARNVSREDAFDYVLGYTIFNDVTARNLQTRHNQWFFGKSLDTFTVMGPWIVTDDEFSHPLSLRTVSRVNGEKRQDSVTSLWITDLQHVISELSKGFTLKAGSIIAMGTPAGVGMGFTPPKFMNSGDVVECEIEGIGILRNKVK